ncbi:hypothetical protein Ancab_000869 [Ancistrocladus abbreviatus]
MKDFCCMAMPPDQDDRQEGIGHCCEDNSRSTPPEKVANVHRKLMKYLQDEEFRDNIRGRKAVWVVPEICSFCLGLEHQQQPKKFGLLFGQLYVGQYGARGIQSSSTRLKQIPTRPRIKLTSDDAREVVHYYITPSLLCLSLGSLSLLLKDMVRLRLEAKFRFCQVFDRIRHTILDLHAIRIFDCKTKWNFLKKTKKKLLEEVYQMDKEVPIWILEKLANLYMKDVEKEALEGNDQDDQKLVDLAEKKLKSIVENSVISNATI